MSSPAIDFEVLPLGRNAMRLVNQRAQALAHEAFTQLREQLRVKACEAICAGLDVHAALADLHLMYGGIGLTTAHPPTGTPGPKTQGGNSAPAHAPVAGPQQSERSGERRGRK